MPMNELPGRSSKRLRLITVALLASTLPALLLGSSSAASPTFGTPVRTPGSAGFEQQINVAPDGGIYVDEPAALPTFEHRLWRSDDGGASFQRLNFNIPASRLPGGGDTDVVITPEGTVYFLDLWAGSNSLAVSTDRGDTWAYGNPITTLPLSDRQWIAYGGKSPITGLDRLYAVYALIQPPSCAMFARSDDGGLTWSFHRPIPEPLCGPRSQGHTNKLVADGDYAAITFIDLDRTVYAAYTEDGGVTWTDPITVSAGEAANDINGTALAGETLSTAWIDEVNGYRVRFARSLDRGHTWEEPITLADDGNAAVFSWVAHRDDKIAVVWYGANEPGKPDTVSDTAEWKAYYAESTDGGATFTTPVAASNVVLKGKVCISGLACTLDQAPGNRSMGDFLAVAIDEAGDSLIAYYDGIRDGASFTPLGGYVVKQN